MVGDARWRWLAAAVPVAAAVAGALLLAPAGYLPASPARLAAWAGRLPPGELVGRLATLGAGALIGWLGLVVTLTVLGRLPGAVGRLLDTASRGITPRMVRRAVQFAFGAAVVVGPLGVPASAAGRLAPPPIPPAPVAGPPADLFWPLGVPGGGYPGAGRPGDRPVTVQPGDTLWSIAARHLPAPADDAAVARAWPLWYRRNLVEIGPDPNLIRPGMQLWPPPAAGPLR